MRAKVLSLNEVITLTVQEVECGIVYHYFERLLPYIGEFLHW